MDGTDENNVNQFTREMLRRAKERSQLLAEKTNQPSTEKDDAIEKMIRKLDQRSSDTPDDSPEGGRSPTKVGRPILKPIGNDSLEKPAKKSVKTFNADGDTVVESKTFISDNDDTDEEEEAEEVEVASNEQSSSNSSTAKDADEDMDQADDVQLEDESGKAEAKPAKSVKLQKLTEFHSKEETDSPVHPHTPLETLEKDDELKGHVSASRTARSSRLSALARNINAWEDDTTHHSIPGSRFSEAANSNTRASLGGKAKFSSASSPVSSPLSFGNKGQIAGELQGFSRKQASPLKQIRESPVPQVDSSSDEEMPLEEQRESPSKIYFGGSPYNRSPKKYVAPSPPPTSAQSPSRTRSRSVSPVKPVRSPVKLAQPVAVGSPRASVGSNQSSPVKSPMKYGSPIKSTVKVPSNESTPSGKPFSAIRMQFEGTGPGKVGPAKPERSRVTPYAPPTSRLSNSKIVSSSVKKFEVGGGNEKDPSSLSVAERAKLFEKSNFCPIPKKPIIVDVQPKRTTVFTSSPYLDSGKPEEIDISSVPSVASEPAKSVKRQAPPPPVAASHGCPPPPPPMPSSSTPNSNFGSKRRSTSPVRASASAHGVKRIKVNAPKPGHIYPSLTDLETEAETENEGHCSEVESMDDSIESQQSLGTEIETIAKACSPIRPVSGGRTPSRYRPSEDFSATFACATVDALIDEALDGQDYTVTSMNFSTAANEPENTLVEAEVESTVVATTSEHSEAEYSANFTFSLTPQSPNASVHEDNIPEFPEDISFSEADTTASSSFTSSPVALFNLSAAAASTSVVNVEKPDLGTADKADTDKSPKNVPETGTKAEEDLVTRQLVHTVSFYRRQQQQQKKSEACTALNDITEQAESGSESEEEVTIPKPNPGDVIRKLEEEVEGRNNAIAQASKALNWCKTLVGFSDSTEYIECERILLIETQRRLALLNSIHRLKTDGALNQQMPGVFSPSKQEVSPSCKGNMKISDVTVPLRRDFFNARRAEYQYHFICLVKNKHHIEHTPLLTFDNQRHGSSLKFSNEFLLENLDPDFQVNLEIYYLECAKEFLPHEAKYRINAKKDKQATMMLSPLLTPSKKSGKGDKHSIQSPAGPDTVKTTSFKYCGGLSIDISSLQRTHWDLNNASGPVAGGINISIQCTAMGGVEHKGFLTLFDDVSGYGAWVRRWCRLGPTGLEFWKYPEDETEGRKPPLGTLNLHECVTSKVRPAPRDVCARANTLLLMTTRAPHPNDKNTLVTSCHKGYTAVRHLISADTRDERDVWCQWLNKALANLRAWDPVAKQSVDDNLF